MSRVPPFCISFSVKIVNSKVQDDIQINDKDQFNQAMIITAKYTKGVHWKWPSKNKPVQKWKQCENQSTDIRNLDKDHENDRN